MILMMPVSGENDGILGEAALNTFVAEISPVANVYMAVESHHAIHVKTHYLNGHVQ